MAVFSSIIGAIGAAAAAVGTVAGVAGQMQQAAGQRKAANAQKRAEQLRENQMQMEAQRKMRETVRQQQLARAETLAKVNAQGAGGEGASALGGAEGSIFGQGGRAIQEINSNAAMGSLLFQANRDVTRGNELAARGGTIAAFGSGLSSLGNGLVNNAKTISRVGGFT